MRASSTLRRSIRRSASSSRSAGPPTTSCSRRFGRRSSTTPLLRAYNDLKLSLDGADYELYTDVKGAFVDQVLARVRATSRAR
jgi:hypothetical protein